MFDPYHKWLGIPREQQPPSYYRLLGVDPGETDPEVIEEMAIRQTSHVRTYQIGPHAEECRRLLGEIGQAARVLLDPDRRRAYDRRLGRQRVTPRTAAAPAGAAAATPVAVAPAVSPGWVLVPEPSGDPDFADLPVPIRRRLGRHTWHGVLALAVAILLFAAGGLAAWRVLGEAAFSLWQPEQPPAAAAPPPATPAGAGFGKAPRDDPPRKPRGTVNEPSRSMKVFGRP
jgi:hypothetical protein